MTIAFDSRSLRRTVISILIIVTLWLVALGIFTAIGHFLFILMLSWLFAIAMEPAILRLTARGIRRGTATTIVGTLVLVCVFAVAAVFGNLFFTQLQQLVTSLPTTVTQSVDWVNTHTQLKLDPTKIADELRLTPEQVGSWTTQIAGGVVGIVTSAVLAAPGGVHLLRVRLLHRRRRPAHPPCHRPVDAAGTAGGVRHRLGHRRAEDRWLRHLEDRAGGALGRCHAVFFWAVGVPYWLPLALLVGITAQFIPVVGTYIGILIPVLFVVFTQPLVAMWIIIFATIYQQIETYVFTPRVSRRTMDVNSGIALAAVFVGAAIWGPIGALIGIPLAAAVVAVVGTYGRRYELVPELASPDPDDVDLDGDDLDGDESPGLDQGRNANGVADGEVDDDPPPPDAEPHTPADDGAPVLSRPTNA